MKKNYFIALLALVFQFANAQLEPVAYRGAFAPAPAAMWTDSWTNWNPNAEAYTDAATVVTVSANITANTTWTTGKTYKLSGTIYVTNNATLTIQPGVVVKGQYSNTGTALIITKGAKINAVGTAASPIVFTSDKAAGTRAAGDWGGIILLGKDKFNQTGGLNNIEGLAANALTEYGGGSTPDSNDNSGILKYVRIEFGGFVFSPNNEINGLTMGAVGAGTTIDNVQVSFSGDDSFEWFGGSVNCKHLVAYRGLDDDFDTDNGYYGTVQYALGIRDPQIADNPALSTSEGFESDNNPSDAEPLAAPNNVNTSAIFSNCTLIGPNFRNTGSLASGYARALRLRRRTELKVINTIFLDWNNNYAGLTDDSTIAKYIAGRLVLNNNIFAGLKAADQTSFPESINPRTKAVSVAMNTILTNSGMTAYTLPYTFDLGAKMTANHNDVVTSSAGILTQAYNTTLSDYSGLDYRPGTLAATGASFADSMITPFVTNPITGSQPVTANVSLCQGAIATPLTATLTSTGVSLKWYKSTTATGTKTAIVGNATPLTTSAGTQYFWVSQLDANGVESAKAPLTVTVNAKPTAIFAGIYDTTTDSASVTNVTSFAAGKYVGTTTQFTFTVPALTDSSLTYLWTVPNGVNIISGGTSTSNTITVNFAGVTPNFVGTFGTISVQAKNDSGCAGTAKTISITTALPVAPAAVKITDGVTATAITNYSKYAGTTTTLLATATASATAASYVWSLPAGVNVVGISGTPTSSVDKIYYSYPFTGAGGVGNTSAGAHKWTVTNKTYTVLVNNVSTVITVSTAKQQIISGNTLDPFLPYGTVISSDNNAILINFAGVTSSTTTVLYIGAKAHNGAGDSVTSNATNADVVANSTSIPGLFNRTYTETYIAPANAIPAVGTAPYSNPGEHAAIPAVVSNSTWAATGYAASTAKLLKLIAAAPVAPSAVKMTNNAISTVTAVTVVSKYVGTSTVLTLTATASATAVSYLWTLPAGVNQLSGGTSNVITVDLAGVQAGVTSLAFSAQSVNVFGTSVVKTLTTTAAAPAIVSKVSNFGLTTTPDATTAYVSTSGATKQYTITASALANTYVITAPENCVVTSASNDTNTSNVLETADLNFTVVYPAGFVSTVAPFKTLSVVAKNGVGTSAPKTYNIKSTTAVTKSEVLVTRTEIYPNPVAETLNIDLTTETKGDLQMTIYSYDGTIVSETKTINLEEGTNSLNENVSTLNKGIYFVRFTNSSNEEVIVKKVIKN